MAAPDDGDGGEFAFRAFLRAEQGVWGEGTESDEGDDHYADVRPRAAGGGADLFHAARLGDVGRITALLAADPEAVNSRDVWSATPLYYAALCGHLGATEALLAAGAVADEGCFDGERVVYAALRQDIRAALAAAAARPPPLGPLATDLRELAPVADGGWLSGLSAPRGAGPAAAPDLTLALPDGTAVPTHRALLWRAPGLREKLATRPAWTAGGAVALHGARGRLPGAALRALVSFLATDRVDCPAPEARALQTAAAAAGLPALATAVRRERATQAHFRRLKRGGAASADAAARFGLAARRFVIHPAALPREARLAADLGGLAARAAALAKAGVEGVGDDVADVLLLPVAPPPGGGGGGGAPARPFFRAHAAILAARSPYFKAALAPGWMGGDGGGSGGRRGEAPPPPPGAGPRRHLRAVRTPLPAPGLAAVLEFAYTGALAAPFEPDAASPGPAPAPPAVDALLEAGGLALAGPPYAAAVADGVARGWAAAPPSLRELGEVALIADARGAAALRTAALARLAGRFDRAAAGVAAAAAAATRAPAAAGSPPSPPPPSSCAAGDTATLAAFVAAAAPRTWSPSAHAAAAAALAAAAARGEASAHPTPATAAEGELLADLREAYLETARGGGGGRRDAVAAGFDARLAALGAAAAEAGLL